MIQPGFFSFIVCYLSFKRFKLFRYNGFTLVEMLVVIVIIAVLSAILFPVFTAARKSAHKAACVSNLRQLCMAQKLYSDDCDRTLMPAKALDYNTIVQHHK